MHYALVEIYVLAQTAAAYEKLGKRREAAELSSYGISVVHDRTLHDGESYNDAYENSLASIQSYLACLLYTSRCV